MRTLHPINDKVLILIDESEAVTKGGIIIPAKAQGTPQWGRAIAIGNNVTPSLENAKVFIGKHSGYHYQAGGRDYVLVKENEILARAAA
jgi:chaperonin GroES